MSKWNSERAYEIVKRGFDIVASTLALVITSPFIGISMLAIMIDDPGDPVFAQTRCGKDGKFFRMHKLRTMKMDAELELKKLLDMNESDGPVFKMKDDPRMTKFGKFLRKTSMDELLQFYDVIRGDMSIVGPRPPLPREVLSYEEWHKERLSIKPGITCYWQIAKNRNDIPFDDWVRMDLKYIKERSIWTDLKIMFATVGAIIGMHGR